MKKILIYRDKGADPFCVASLLAALQQEAVDEFYELGWADKALLQTPVWQEDTHLLIFPGGRDIPYHRALQGAANGHILDFVRQGGRFFGICAGAYYGSAIIEFEMGSEMEVVAERELKFFPGIARGPAYGAGKFSYQNQQGAQMAALELCPSFCKAITAAAYYNGGCAFIEAEKYSTVSVIGRYADLDETPAAIVECAVGAGKALLCGVHPEYSATYEAARDFFSECHLADLEAIELQRRQLFAALLNSAGIKS